MGGPQICVLALIGSPPTTINTVVGIAIATTASSGLSIVMAVLFGYFPARRAARMDLIEALRHE